MYIFAHMLFVCFLPTNVCGNICLEPGAENIGMAAVFLQRKTFAFQKNCEEFQVICLPKPFRNCLLRQQKNGRAIQGASNSAYIFTRWHFGASEVYKLLCSFCE